MSNRDARHQAIHQIREVHKSIRNLCLAAGITAESLNIPLEILDGNLSFEAIIDELRFLVEFRDGPYHDALKFKSQKSDEWWRNLEVIFDNYNLPEQVILRAKFKAMRQKWRKHYGRPKSTTKQDEGSETPPRVRVRPKEGRRNESTHSNQ